MLALLLDNNAIKLWSLQSGKALHTLKDRSVKIATMSFSPDSMRQVSSSGDKFVSLWNHLPVKTLHTLKGEPARLVSVSFSPDDRVLASVSHDRTVTLWDIRSGKALHALEGHSSEFHATSFSPDDGVLASVSDDETNPRWRYPFNGAPHEPEGYSSKSHATSFSPDGKILASASDDQIVKLWDVESGKVLHTLNNGQPNGLYAVAFSPDSKILAVASSSKINIWDVDSGNFLQKASVLLGREFRVTLSPDNETLVWVWDLPLGVRVIWKEDTVKIYKPPPKKHSIHSLLFREPISWVSYDKDSLYIDTKWLTADSYSGGQHAYPRASSPLISHEEAWICLNDKRMIWIPHNFRSEYIAVCRNTVCFYDRGFGLILLRFSF
jgi:WD40 repeat protein